MPTSELSPSCLALVYVSGRRRVPLPPLRISPFHVRCPIRRLPAHPAAERAEEVREGAEPGEREREVEPVVRLDRVQRVELREVVGLVLHREAAALRVVITDAPAVQH